MAHNPNAQDLLDAEATSKRLLERDKLLEELKTENGDLMRMVMDLRAELRWERGQTFCNDLVIHADTATDTGAHAQKFLMCALATDLTTAPEEVIRTVLRTMYRIHDNYRNVSNARLILQGYRACEGSVNARWPDRSAVLPRNLNVLGAGVGLYLENAKVDSRW